MKKVIIFFSVLFIYHSVYGMNATGLIKVTNNPFIKQVTHVVTYLFPEEIAISYDTTNQERVELKRKLPRVTVQELKNLGVNWLEFVGLQTACFCMRDACDATGGPDTITYSIGCPLTLYTIYKLIQAVRYGITTEPEKNYYTPNQAFSGIKPQELLVLNPQEKTTFKKLCLIAQKYCTKSEYNKLIQEIPVTLRMNSQHIFWFIKNIKGPTNRLGKITDEILPQELQRLIFAFVLGVSWQKLVGYENQHKANKSRGTLLNAENKKLLSLPPCKITRYTAAQVIQNARRLTKGKETFSCTLTKQGITDPQFSFVIDRQEVDVTDRLARSVIECYMTDTFGNQRVELTPHTKVMYTDARFRVD